MQCLRSFELYSRWVPLSLSRFPSRGWVNESRVKLWVRSALNTENSDGFSRILALTWEWLAFRDSFYLNDSLAHDSLTHHMSNHKDLSINTRINSVCKGFTIANITFFPMPLARVFQMLLQVKLVSKFTLTGTEWIWTRDWPFFWNCRQTI